MRTSAGGSPSGSDMARDVRKGVSRQAPVRAPRVLVTTGGEGDARHREATASSMGAQQVDGSSIGEEIKRDFDDRMRKHVQESGFIDSRVRYEAGQVLRRGKSNDGVKLNLRSSPHATTTPALHAPASSSRGSLLSAAFLIAHHFSTWTHPCATRFQTRTPPSGRSSATFLSTSCG